jgi:hypothetical protein
MGYICESVSREVEEERKKSRGMNGKRESGEETQEEEEEGRWDL